jgi:hypothetical protein
MNVIAFFEARQSTQRVLEGARGGDPVRRVRTKRRKH